MDIAWKRVIAGVVGIGVLVVMAIGLFMIETQQWPRDDKKNPELIIVGACMLLAGAAFTYRNITYEEDWPAWPFIKGGDFDFDD